MGRKKRTLRRPHHCARRQDGFPHSIVAKLIVGKIRNPQLEFINYNIGKKFDVSQFKEKNY